MSADPDRLGTSILHLRQRFGILDPRLPEGTRRDPRDTEELRQVCLHTLAWLDPIEGRYSLMVSGALSERLRLPGEPPLRRVEREFVEEVAYVRCLLRRIAGPRVHPDLGEGPWTAERATAALDRVVSWCNQLAPPPRPVGAPTILSLGRGCYQVDGGDPVAVTDSEDDVLQAFLEVPALTEARLIEMSGYEDAARVLRKITDKYPELARAIRLPSGKGCGGYAVRIRNRTP